MLIAKIQNNQVVDVADYRAMFISNVFPSSGPTDEWLAEQSCKRVNLYREHDRLTQVLEPATPSIEGDWVYTVQVRDLTSEEIQAQKDAALSSIRATRNALLKDSDGTQAADNPSPKKQDWATYRQALRDLPQTISNSGEDPRLFSAWPQNPDYVAPNQ